MLALVPVVESIVPDAAACTKFSNDSSKLALPRTLLHSFFKVYLEIEELFIKSHPANNDASMARVDPFHNVVKFIQEKLMGGLDPKMS